MKEILILRLATAMLDVGHMMSVVTRGLTAARFARLRAWIRPLSAAGDAFPMDDGAGQPSLLLGSRSPGFGGAHDVGGLNELMGVKVDIADPVLQPWEQETHALLVILVGNGYLTTDELRRNIEAMDGDHYRLRSYYCKWATSMALGLLERNVLTHSDLDAELLGGFAANNSTSHEQKFVSGQRVRVKEEHKMARWRKPHLRTPGYIFGVEGVIESYEGAFADPSFRAFRSMLLNNKTGEQEERKQHLYRVEFLKRHVWPEGKALEHAYQDDDTVSVEIYEPWLVAANSDELDPVPSTWEMDPLCVIENEDIDGHQVEGIHHDHSHDHGHEHQSRAEIEQRAVDLESSLHSSQHDKGTTWQESDVMIGERLSDALIALLSRPQHEGLGDSLLSDIRTVIDANESARIRADGARLVARAWVDPEGFQKRLLKDAAAAASELGIATTNSTTHTKLKVVQSQAPTFSSKGVHNLITCTLCSCYPLSLLGLSPKWYKSRSFRARAVREPRAMLRDSFGLDLPEKEWTIKVHDSTADLRYLVLPPRPAGTAGWSEENLRSLATRDTMIGVALPRITS